MCICLFCAWYAPHTCMLCCINDFATCMSSCVSFAFVLCLSVTPLSYVDMHVYEPVYSCYEFVCVGVCECAFVVEHAWYVSVCVCARARVPLVCVCVCVCVCARARARVSFVCVCARAYVYERMHG